MHKEENIFTAGARELELSRPARRRGITELMRTPPRGAVRCVRRMPRGEEMRGRDGGASRAPAWGCVRADFRRERSEPNVRPPDVDTRR